MKSLKLAKMSTRGAVGSKLRRCAGSMLFSAAALLGAQAKAQLPSVVPLPFAYTVAGLPAGGSNVQCPATADIANNNNQHLGDGCLPTQALLASIYGAFTDADGNIYITENGTNNDIRVIYKGGATLTQLLIASSANLTNFTPIPGRIYTLAGALPSTLTVKNGTKYACNGQTTGPQALDSAGDGCPGTQAYIKPRGLFVDPLGNVFFVSTGGGNTLKVLYAGGAQVSNLIVAENPGVTPQVGYVYKLAGQSSASYSGDGAIASASGLVVVRDTVVDSYGNVYVSDGTSSAASGNTVRVIYGGLQAPPGIANPTLGFIYTFAGGAGCTSATSTTTCPAGDLGDGGKATAATLNGPYTLFLDRFNNLFISEYSGNRLRVVYSGGTIGGLSNLVAGNIYTYAGTGTSTANGTVAQNVKFNSVQVSGLDNAGNIYVEDATTKDIWKFDANSGVGYVTAGLPSGGSVTKLGAFCSGTAGPKAVDNFGDGCPATQATFSDIGRISFDPQGNAYLGENGNGIVRELALNTQFPSTAVGSASQQPLAFLALQPVTLSAATFALQGAPTAEYSDAGGSTCAAAAALSATQSCVLNVNFAPAHEGLRPAAVQLQSATGTLLTELISGIGIAAQIAVDPGTRVNVGSNLKAAATATDANGGVYVADDAGNQVLKGSVNSTTLTPLVTGLNAPSGVAVDSAGNVYVADTGNNRVVESSPAGAPVAVLGSGLNGPRGVAVDVFGNVWIADTGNNRIVEVAPNGVQTTPVTFSGLSAPMLLSFDPSGNLFVVDSGNSRIVELPVNGSQIAIPLAAGVIPAGVAVDASGTVYVSDSAGKQVLAFAPGAAEGNVLLNGLTRPAGLAVDADGDVFIADSGASSAVYLLRSTGNITFPITNVGSSSTAAVNVVNVGNAGLVFSAGSLYSLNGSAQYSLASSTTNGCTAGVTYAPGTECSFTATFAPVTQGNTSATAKFNTNAANTATASALLTGSGQQLVTTSASLAVTSPTGTITYGQPVTLTAAIKPSQSAGTPTGTVTFTVDNKAQTPQAFGSGSYTLVLNPAVGTHTVTVAFSGDAVYASSAATTSFTVGKAVTTTSLTATPVNSNGTVTMTFTATVASATATGETGTVSFYAGSQLLSSTTLNPATRTATYTTSSLSFAANTFTAVYSGDSNFSGSTSAVFAPVGDFAIGTSTSAITIPQSGVANVTFVVASTFGGTGTITPSCSGLPANSICRFYPTTIPVGGLTSVQLEVYTNVNPSLAHNQGWDPFGRRSEALLAGLVPFTLLLLGRRSRRVRGIALAGVVLLVSLVPLAGCGEKSAAQSNQGFVTPTGAYTITVTFAGAAPLQTHSTSFALTVIPNTTGF